jgi:hypothetical protein
MLLEIYNPNPIPLKDLLAVNSLGYISGSIPDPVSFTITTRTSFSGPSFSS